MKKTKTIDMILCALFAALICIGAFIKIPVPVVPFTMQFLFTALAGMLLDAKLGALSVIVYMIMGLAGLPVFTQGGGLSYLLKPTFGYIIGFVIGTYVTGTIANKTSSPSFKRLLCANFAGLAIIYFIGAVYYFMISNLYLKNDLGVKTLFIYCVLFALPGDIFLSFISAAAAKKIIPAKNIYMKKYTGTEGEI